MSSVTDSIMSSVILIIVVIVLGSILVATTLKNSAEAAEQDLSVYAEERTNLALDAFLISTENTTKRDMRELIGESMLRLETNFTTEGIEVDVVAETKERLDLMFGADEYYLDVEPIVKGASLMFILDGSRTVAAERDTIAQNLQIIQETIRDSIRENGMGDERVFTKIFILPGRNAQLCEEYIDLELGDTECQELTIDQLYGSLIEDGWEQPHFGFGSFEQWKLLSGYAKERDFASSDWAAGTAFAAREYDNDIFLQLQASVNAIIPLSDELATSSKPNATFAAGSVAEFLVGSWCEATCGESRAAFALKQAIQFLENSSSRVFPIYSVNCDFAYDPGYNGFSSGEPYPEYLAQFRDRVILPSEYPEVTWCSLNSCEGCTSTVSASNPAVADVCLNVNCQDTLLEHMELLAQETSGEVINVNVPDQIPGRIVQAFASAVDEYAFTIGEQDFDRERFVSEKIVELPGGFLTKITVWVYQD